MQNRWNEKDQNSAIERYTRAGANFDLALCTYASRLLGADPKLVLHGGGNSSVKTTMPDLVGDMVDVICVKGSGWDMGSIEPPGLPAVRLAPLLRLRERESLDDETMVNIQRSNLVDADAPNPSVETLLHAFLPHRFVFHTHANAVLALTDQPHGETLCREVYGTTMGIVPYVMPGFALSLRAADVYEANPSVEGLILLNHGIFVFADTAREAYERMVEKVSAAEDRIAAAGRVSVAGVHLPRAAGRARPKSFSSVRLPAQQAKSSDIAPILRGLAAVSASDNKGDDFRRWIMVFRTSHDIVDFVSGEDVARYSQQGTATPDHVIRTKAKPVILPPADLQALEAFATGAAKAIDAYKAEYHDYFERNNTRHNGGKRALDAIPRVMLVPGLGLFALGSTRKDALVAADLAEANVDVITAAETLGSYQVISEADLFDVEYWSLEQAKLGKGKSLPLAGNIVVVTGGGSGIGAATVAAFRAAGAEVAVLDIDESQATTIAKTYGGIGIRCDVTDVAAVRSAFANVIETFGGVDIVVSNAGAAWQGRIGDVDEATLRRSFEMNFWAHQWVAATATRIMRAQKTGGCLLFNVSKQALNPGPSFGPYGLPKAATLALMRQYAIDYGEDGIRANAVNADRIRSQLLNDQMISERARARGVSDVEYMSGNLLKREVTASDVADAFVRLALSRRTSAAILTVDGGNIAAAPR